jgi:hypothetical protein
MTLLVNIVLMGLALILMPVDFIIMFFIVFFALVFLFVFLSLLGDDSIKKVEKSPIVYKGSDIDK